MSIPEFNPTDEAPIDREEWEKAMGAKSLHDLFPSLIGSELLPEAQEAAIEWINLYCEAAELEDHNCTSEDFRRCEVCDQINEINHRAFSVAAVWQKHWAAGILRAFELAAQPQPAPCPEFPCTNPSCQCSEHRISLNENAAIPAQKEVKIASTDEANG